MTDRYWIAQEIGGFMIVAGSITTLGIMIYAEYLANPLCALLIVSFITILIAAMIIFSGIWF